MIRRIAILLGLLVLLAKDSSARQAPKDLFACESDPDRVVSLVGLVSVNLGAEDVVSKVMPCLLTLWAGPAKNDGDELPGLISSGFLTIMEENPPLFFSFMSKNPQVFTEWLKQLPENSFTWYRSPPCPLEENRKRLISLLKREPVQAAKLQLLKEQVINRLDGIRCRQID
ncbi:MAG: hypothetical protein ACLQMT_03895 [Candidatus Acidiferrales bacterium]